LQHGRRRPYECLGGRGAGLHRGEFETQSVANMTRLVDQGNRHGIPVLAVTAVGKDMARDAKYMRLASRICAELAPRS